MSNAMILYAVSFKLKNQVQSHIKTMGKNKDQWEMSINKES